MSEEYIQILRQKLNTRLGRLSGINYQFFYVTLKQFWNFLHHCSVFEGILMNLTHRHRDAEAKAKSVADKNRPNANAPVFYDEEEHIAVSYFIIKMCVESDERFAAAPIADIYAPSHTMPQKIQTFVELFAQPLCDYLDEHLSDQRAILSILRRYKHKCEWFKREELFKLWQGDTRHGERLLARHLYEYLHDQGVDFMVEPSSVSGEVDLIVSQTGEHRILADAKIFNLDKGKGYIARGFDQIYAYTQDYNEPFGYLIIYKTCPEDLKFVLVNQTQSIPFIVHNGKTIFILTVDICTELPSASKRGTLKAVQVSMEDLVSAID